MPEPRLSRMNPVTVADQHAQLNISTIGTPVGFSSYTPPSDFYSNPSNYVSAATTGVPANGSVFFTPYDVSAKSLLIKGLACNVASGATLGSATSGLVYLGIYKDDGTGGVPDFTQLLSSGTADITTSGVKYVQFQTALALAAGRYWLGLLIVYIGTPTTQATFSGYGTSVLTLPFAGTSTPGLLSRMWQTATGLTTLPTTRQTLSAYSGTNGPVVSVRAN